VLDRYHWTEADLQYYDKLIMNEADLHGTLEAAKKEGHQEGLQEGEKKRSIEIAQKLLKLGLSMDQIVESTGLSAEEIQSL